MEKGNCILAPVDFSEDSRIALEAADLRLQNSTLGLIVLHVIPPWSPGTDPDVPGGLDALDAWMQKPMRTPKDRVTWGVREGDPAVKILQLAREMDVQTILMGRGGDEDRMSSVARTVRENFTGKVELFYHLASLICRDAA